MKKLFTFLVALFAATTLFAGNPSSEIRAVWLTTNGGMDWPTGSYTPSVQKQKLTAILDKLQEANFNTIIFQVQVKGDVLWESKIQPAMADITGNGSKELSYDVCNYVIEECHKRNMECHAWIVPYRIGSASEAKRYASNAVKHPSITHSKLLVTYGNAYYLDPGNPATTEYLVELYRELVTKYDFDGINFDYTRYPGSDFNDATSYSKYNPNGYSKDDWRRWSINCFIEEMYEMVKSTKSWMKVGAAPIGTYVNVAGYGNMTAFGVYQDAAYWMSSGNHDLLIPQMYWNERFGYSVHMQTWVDYCAGRQIVIGLAPYKMLDGSNNWEHTVITDQIEKQRKNPGTCGVCFFRSDFITDVTQTKISQLYNALKNNYFSTPAKIPPMEYLEVTKPNTPVNLIKSGNTLSWNAPALDSKNTPIKNYVIYRKVNGKTDISDSNSIVAIVRTTSYTLPETEDAAAEYAVTAIDRNNFESDVAEFAGITCITPDNLPKEYYNLQGIKVENPGSGTYILKQGSKATKIHINN